MRASHFLLSIICLLPLCALSWGQSFNVNINDLGSDPGSNFGAAANQLGFWNGIYGNFGGPRAILDLGGQTTAVQYTASGGLGNSGENNFTGNTGDYALLLNSFAIIADAAQYRFT